MSERALHPLDLSGSLSRVAQKWRKWKRSFEYYLEGKGLNNTPKKLCSFCITREWKFRIFSRILQTLTQLTIIRIRMLCALENWITFFVLKKTYSLSDTFRQMAPSEGELVDKYIVRLYQQVRHCNFGAALEENL